MGDKSSPVSPGMHTCVALLKSGMICTREHLLLGAKKISGSLRVPAKQGFVLPG